MLASGDIPTIYGIDLQARSLASVYGSDSDCSQFLVGTQSLRIENQVHLINYDSYSHHLSKYIFSHPVGEIWSLATASFDERLFTTVYATFNEAKTERKMRASMWRLSSELQDQTDAMEDSSQPQPLENVCHLPTEVYGNVVNVLTHPDHEPSWMLLMDSAQLVQLSCHACGADEFREVASIRLDEGTRPGQRQFTVARWSPHDMHQEVATAFQRALIGWDMRSGKRTFHVEQSHSQLVRDLDYNPYRQYQITSCGDDGSVCLWDVRMFGTSSLVNPLSSTAGVNTNSSRHCSPLLNLTGAHSHWVWSVRYNPSHDMLLLSCSSDTRVALYTVPSYSSATRTGADAEDDDEDVEEEEEEKGDNSEDEDADGSDGEEKSTKSSTTASGRNSSATPESSRRKKGDKCGRSGEENGSSTRGTKEDDALSLEQITAEKVQDGVLRVFDGHEDSVYAAEWSQVDSWVFASLSYDGRLVINHVPIVEKLKIMRSK